MSTEKEIPILTAEMLNAALAKLRIYEFCAKNHPEHPVGRVLDCGCLGPMPECACMKRERLRRECETAIVIATAELEALRRDASRYRWLRDNSKHSASHEFKDENNDTRIACWVQGAEFFDGVIDAAIAQEKAK